MKVMLRVLIVAMYLWVCVVHGKASYIFLFDNQETEKRGQPFYVTYQLVTALYEGSTSLFVSSSLLAHVVQRSDFYAQQLKKEDPHAQALYTMYQKIQQNVHDNIDIKDITRTYSMQWFEKEQEGLAGLSADQHQQNAFNFLCYMMHDQIQQVWNIYELSPGFLLLQPKYMAHPVDVKQIKLHEVRFTKGKDKPFMQAVQKLKTIIGNESLYVYASGHGTADKQPRVCGLLVKNFKWLLDELATMRTKLFVYNSCFAGDKNVVVSFEDEDKKIKEYAFPIVNIAITHAPTYTFGYAEGFVLPPYTSYKMLQEQDVEYGTLHPRFLQNFTEFFAHAYAGKLKVELINPYRTCDEYKCNIVQVENIPTILRPGAKKFEIIDTDILFQEHEVCILYKNYMPTKKLQGKVVFIPFIPGCTWYEIGNMHIQTNFLDIGQWAKYALLGIEDLYAHYTLYVPQCVCNAVEYKHVLFFYDAPVVPRGIKQNTGVYFEKEGIGYVYDVREGISQSVEQADQESVHAYIALYKKHNHIREQNLVEAYYKYQEQLQVVQKECVQEKICAKK